VRDDEAERIESDFADKENKRPKKEHECPESETKYISLAITP
jgi:hypothetical protein